MSETPQRTFAPLRPYDSTLDDNLSMYDRLPYERDADLCNKGTLALVSGNLIKYYKCNIQDPIKIDTMDDVTTYKIADDKREPLRNHNVSDDDIMEDALTDEITTEQMDELLGNSNEQ